MVLLLFNPSPEIPHLTLDTPRSKVNTEHRFRTRIHLQLHVTPPPTPAAITNTLRWDSVENRVDDLTSSFTVCARSSPPQRMQRTGGGPSNYRTDWEKIDVRRRRGAESSHEVGEKQLLPPHARQCQGKENDEDKNGLCSLSHSRMNRSLTRFCFLSNYVKSD